LARLFLGLPPESGFEVPLTSAPAAIRNLIASAWPSEAAHMIGVVPRSSSLPLTLALWSTSTLIASILPLRAASIRGVSPCGPASLGSEPALIKRSIMGALPRMDARYIAVAPSRLAFLTSAPAAIRTSASATLLS
jgi:hypothetical protein